MTRTTYAERENQRQAAWKSSASHLPASAREDGIYRRGTQESRPSSFCLPRECSSLNLLPEIRAAALQAFTELGIAWHDSVDGGPSNHLRDSQVQCVNALAAMMDDPERIVAAFGRVLDIADVTEIEPGRFLTFEYIGPVDYFHESLDGPRTRGSRCTSVDAAFSFRTSAGTEELALVEWKYTEHYQRVQKPSDRRDFIRTKRYQADFERPDGPIRSELVPLHSMFTEPIYQLMRQQLLADRLESDPHTPYEVVRIVHVLSPFNFEYEKSLHRPEHLALGSTVHSVWHELLRRPDRYIRLDPETFMSEDVTSAHYVERYGPTFHDEYEAHRRAFYQYVNSFNWPDYLDTKLADGDLWLCTEDPSAHTWTLSFCRPQTRTVGEFHSPVQSAYNHIAAGGWLIVESLFYELPTWCHVEILRQDGTIDMISTTTPCAHVTHD